MLLQWNVTKRTRFQTPPPLHKILQTQKNNIFLCFPCEWERERLRLWETDIPTDLIISSDIDNFSVISFGKRFIYKAYVCVGD